MPPSNPASDRHPFQGSRTRLALNPHPQPAPCRKSMLIPPNYSYKNSNRVQEKKRETERNKMELTYLCGVLYIMCKKQVSEVFKMEISKILRPSDMFLEHFVQSSNTYIRNSLFCYFRLEGVYFSTFPTCDQKITQASEFNSPFLRCHVAGGTSLDGMTPWSSSTTLSHLVLTTGVQK